MKQVLFNLIILAMIACFSCKRGGGAVISEDDPAIGLETELAQLYRLDLLPQYRPNIVEQVSSYDTTGLNDDGFSGRYSYIRKEGDKLVLADLAGPGVINRIWTPTPTADTIQFFFDGEDSPRISIPFIDLFSGKVYPFVNPICGNEVGGYYCYVPIQYSKSCIIKYVGERIQFHQIQFRPYPAGTAIESFTMSWPEKAKTALKSACLFWNGESNPLNLLREAGIDVKEEIKQFFLLPGETIDFFNSRRGGRIVGLELECGTVLEGSNKDVMVQARWDNDADAAFYVPAADFFGYAFGRPAMRSIVAGNSSDGINYCYLPMPFQKKAEMKMVYERRKGTMQPKVELRTKVYYVSIPQNPELEGHLYAAWRREILPKDGEPYVIADIKDKGHYVGTLHQAQGLRPGMTLFFEGDDVTFVDGKMRMHGTGSEDYYNGGWYALLDRWDRGVSLPIHGSLDYSLPMCRTGGYRFYLTDKLSFENELLLTIEHGPEHNLFPVDYTTVAFYYGNKPPVFHSQPTEELRTVYHPAGHVFFPQLMDLSLGSNTQIENSRERWLIASTDNEGLVRIMLNDIPEGTYKIKLSYLQTPEGGAFSIWNRQKMIADWKDTYSPQRTFMEEQELGVINLTRQTNSISIKVLKTDQGNKFQFENLYLEKQ